MKKILKFFPVLMILAMITAQMFLAPAHAGAAVKKNGLVTVKGKYYFYKNGKAVKNTWKTVKGKKYYFGKKGAAATKSTKINKVYYVFDKKGRLLKGRKTHVTKVSGVYYQIDKKGRAKSGWDSKKVYCYAKDGSRIRNGWSTDKKYYMNAKGKKSKGIITTGGWSEDGEDFEEIKFAALDTKTGLVDKDLTKKLNKLAQYEKDFAPLREIIGEPLKSTYTNGCYYGPEVDGEHPYAPADEDRETYKGDGHLEYKNFAISTYRAPDGTEFFMNFENELF